MSRFDQYAATNSRSKGCPRCGSPGRSAGQVGVHLTELGPTGSREGSRQLESRGRNMCEDCAVDVYERLKAIFVEETTRDAEVSS